MISYLLFILTGLTTGIIFWTIRRYSVPAVLALIFALGAPLLTLFVVAQRERNIAVKEFIMEEVSAGNSLARVVLAIHVYLILWLLFLAVRGIVYLFSPEFREKSRNIRAYVAKQMGKIKKEK